MVTIFMIKLYRLSCWVGMQLPYPEPDVDNIILGREEQLKGQGQPSPRLHPILSPFEHIRTHFCLLFRYAAEYEQS